MNEKWDEVPLEGRLLDALRFAWRFGWRWLKERGHARDLTRSEVMQRVEAGARPRILLNPEDDNLCALTGQAAAAMLPRAQVDEAVLGAGFFGLANAMGLSVDEVLAYANDLPPLLEKFEEWCAKRDALDGVDSVGKGEK